MNASRLKALSAALVAGGTLWWLAEGRPASTSGPLRQEAYVWQRSWTPAVQRAVAEQGGSFSALPVLAAEVSFKGGRPALTRVSVDLMALREAKLAAYPVIRVGEYKGSFQPDAPATGYLIQLTRSLLEEWSRNGVEPREVQVDFDCATSKLAGYRSWIQLLKNTAAPVPVTITALPTWLTSRDFVPLVRATDGFVLQVHSFQPPRNAVDPYVLCDPRAAVRYAGKAARAGVPFRVALPTYGYHLLFDEHGRLQGLAAEGSDPDWPEDLGARQVKADPVALASLVKTWTDCRPAAMQGVIWYRLPNRDDQLNWSWPTLAAVMRGEPPVGRLAFDTRIDPKGLVELAVANEGDGPAGLPANVGMRWSGARLVAGDGLGGFELEATAPQGARLRRTFNRAELDPGERIAIGWLRLSAKTEVQIEY